jgi:response regulator RpfG family c-di-GMP phosphodiesterase
MGTEPVASALSQRWGASASASLPCDEKSWQRASQAEPPRSADDGSLSDTEGILFALALAVEQRDRQTAGHCERLALMSVALGIGAGLERAELLALYRGGYLHDVGKVGIPDSIMLKPGKLTSDEWLIMRSHPQRGEEICRPMSTLTPVLPLIRYHHERWDGSGYPDGLRGEQIPLGARLLQVADIYDALISPRPYKPAYAPAQALEMIRDETKRGWRDPGVVELFMAMHDTVIHKIADYTAQANRTIESMCVSLGNLRLFLEAAQTS